MEHETHPIFMCSIILVQMGYGKNEALFNFSELGFKKGFRAYRVQSIGVLRYVHEYA